MIKIRKEIADLEVAKEKIPERLAALEKKIINLQSLLYNAMDTAIVVCLEYAGLDKNEDREYGDGWVERNIKG